MRSLWRYLWASFFLSSHIAHGIEIHFQISGSNGVLESPNYPFSYPLNVTCIWTIANPNAKLIKLKFLDFHLEKAKRCIYDYVQVRDEKTRPWSRVSRHCGFELPPLIKSKGTFLQLKFFSDGLDIVERGFRAKWEIESDYSKESGCVTDPEKPSSPSPPLCGNRRKKTLIFKQICPTPILPDMNEKDCNCGTYKDLGDSHRPFWIERVLIRKANKMRVNNIKVPYLNYTTNDTQSEISNVEEDMVKKHGLHKISSGHGPSKVLISTFSCVLTLFIAVFLLLLLLLLRKNKEIFQLKQTCVKRPFTSDWTSYPISASLQSRTRSEQGYMKVPTFSKLSPCNRPSPCTYYGAREISNKLSPHNSIKRTGKIMREDWNGHRTTSHIIRTKSETRKYMSSNEDVNDYSGDDTSDVYVSSGFTSPINPSRSCRCQRKDSYNI